MNTSQKEPLRPKSLQTIPEDQPLHISTVVEQGLWPYFEIHCMTCGMESQAERLRVMTVMKWNYE